MIRHSLKISIRNVSRTKTYTLINTVGLVLGISVSLMMLIHIRQELNYESGFNNASRIYRVSYTTWAKSALPLAESLQEYFPAIEAVGRFGQWRTNDVMIHGSTHVPVRQGLLADESVLQIFDFPFVNSYVEGSFRFPNKIILTESLARKVFPDGNPIGKVVRFGGTDDLEVTGVMGDLPQNTHLEFEYLISMPSLVNELPSDRRDNKGWMSCFTYVLMPRDHRIKEFDSRLREFQYNFFEDYMTREQVDAGDEFFEFYPIQSIHLHSHKEQEMGRNSDVSYVYLFGAMAIIIIVMASVNFINLFITQLLKRAREVGLRKVIGARRSQLIAQFMMEGFAYVGLAGIIALAVCNAAIPYYNELANLALESADLFSFNNLVIFGGVAFTIFLLACGIPSIFISGFNPIDAIRGIKLPTSSLLLLRKRLVAFQFIISIFMIIGSVAVFRQMDFLNNKDLGFDKENVMSIQLYGKLWQEAVINREVLRSELERSTMVKSVANVSSFLGNSLSVESLIPEGIDSVEANNLPSERFMRADEGFVRTMNLTVVEGRNFDPLADPVNDSTSTFLINEAAARQLNLENPVGTMARNGWTGSRGRIVGIIKDFNYASLHFSIEPIVIEYRPYWVGNMLVRLEAGKTGEAIDFVKRTIHRVAPDSQILYSFVDDNLVQMYSEELNIKKALLWFSSFAVLIAGLGLFALSVYISEVRTKEVGIRKVLGSSVSQVVLLFTQEYFRIIGIAFVIAAPVSYYVVRQWLSRFAYRISLEWWMFLIPGFAVLILALLAVSMQSFKTALTNPSESLRSE